MYVSRIRVAGIKCFDGPCEVDLPLDPEPGWTVLAGENGAGKTALLQALALALGAHPPVDPARWLAPGRDSGWIEAEPTPGSRLSRAEKPAPRPAAGQYLRRRTAPLAADLVEDGILPDGWRVTDPTSHHVARGGLEVHLSELGAGITALATLASSIDRDQAGPVLIDDVDAHLHPVWQQRIGGWLTARFPQAQFVVATHSPYVCQAADPGTLVHLPGPAAGRPPYRVAEEVRQRVLYGSGDDTALSELFGLASAYSPAAEAERRMLVRLERKLYAGRASEAELAAYRELGAKLNSSLSARVDEVAARVLGREP